ncbi:regulating synaptic membrane exocytosis protein 2 isoform X4 [Nasonia vitripennis]|uniref:Regulating synaptic membrane exocytosis protein 2 n=1 Tax=Nasonia vitripennis TaxID=7425 RepID=A0A7M7QBH9_NASVI|nr:regulating synaptic membrane exocytosis protein 2 isoform X4 [Nasonia vitripennis]
MEEMPDLSHLTPEERRHIESVMMRQKQEEEHQNEIMRRKQNEVQVLEDTITRARTERLKSAEVDLDKTCQICLKTKFADGVGHICNYCNVRCCARCSGKVSLRSNKVIWVCILCRKKQELLSKSGQWIMKSNLGGADSAMLRRMQEDMQGVLPPGLLVDQTHDKRPKLERAHSAAEKENLPLLQRSSSLLRRQYSHQDQIPPGRRLSTSDSGVEMSVSPHSRTLPTPHVAPYQSQQTPRHPAAFPEDDPNLYRGELDGLMRQNSSYQRQRQIYQEQNSDIAMAYGHPVIDQSGMGRPAMHPGPMPPQQVVQQQYQQHPHQQPPVQQQQQLHPSHAQGPGGHGQRSFSSSEEERSTPECASDEHDDREHGKVYFHNGHDPGEPMTAIEYNGERHSPRKEESTLVRRSFRRNGDEWRADSRRFTERRGKKTVRFHGGTNAGGDSQEDWSWEADRQGSQDSATKDSGIDTSSTFTSSEDSNRGDLPKYPSPWQVSSDGQKMIGRMVLDKSSQGSGVSSSSILGLKVVGGQLLRDGTIGALIEKVKKGSPADLNGQLRNGDEVLEWNGCILQGKSFQEVSDIIAMSRSEPQVELVVSRDLNATSDGGLPVKQITTPQLPMIPLGHPGQIGPQTGPGSPGGGALTPRRVATQSQWRQKHEITLPQQSHHKGLKKCILWELYDARGNKPSVLVTSPGSPDLYATGRAASRQFRHPITAQPTAGGNSVGGRIQVKLNFNPGVLQLMVTLVCATGLTPRSNGQPRSSYAKVYLLPDRSEKSKKRTKTLANTNEPRWDQTFVYNGIRWSELRQRSLEITVWDYGRYGANDFLGEVILSLAASSLNDELEWHYLMAHEEHRQAGYYQDTVDDVVTTPGDCHLSPPSTTSRLSDSDTSECDITDCDGSREHRRTADGASISSIGSSSRFHNMPPNYKRHYSSPPPEKELCVDGEHRSRRDMSPQGRKRAALMGSREQPASISGYHQYRKVNFRQFSDEPHRTTMLGHRSHSAAPMDSPSLHYRGRSQSPTGHRSLSPPDHRSIPYTSGYMSASNFYRIGSRSATATPTGSPKKRQLPQIPANLHAALKERVAQDLEERARFIRHRNRPMHTFYRSGMGGWERRYSGLSDSDLPSMGHEPHSLSHSHVHRMPRSRRGHISPEKDVLADLGDSDMESIASVTSSAFSTQSERPRGSRGLIPTVKNVFIPGVVSPMPLPPRRARRKHRLRVPCSECHCPSNNPCKPRSKYHPNSKHNYHLPSHHNPLVRSKSAVVRSLCKRMRAPFTRSHTVDESVLRYYSPETSEYTVSEALLLKPEYNARGGGGGGGKSSRIPEIYVEDCLSVNFNKRLIDKFRAKNWRYADIKLTSSGSSAPYEPTLPHLVSATAIASQSSAAAAGHFSTPHHRRSRSWQDRSTRSSSALCGTGKTASSASSSNAALARAAALASAAATTRRRSLFCSSWTSGHTPRLLDYSNTSTKNTTHRSSMRRSLLSSKARSFDYDAYHCYHRQRDDHDDYDLATTTTPTLTRRSSRHPTGRQGPLSSRRSRSFEYESVSGNIFSDDSLQTARQKIKKNMSLSDEGYGDKILALGDRSKSYYDSNGDGKLIRDLRKKKSRQNDLRLVAVDDDEHEPGLASRLMYGYDSELSCGETEIYLPSEYGPVDASKRKYNEFVESKPAAGGGLVNDGFEHNDEHIYCSIDEVNPAYRSELEELSRWRSGGRRRTRSTDSYLNADYALYDNWTNLLDEGYVDGPGTADQRYFAPEEYNRQSVRYCSDEYDANLEDSSRPRITGARAQAAGREATIATEAPAYYENVPYSIDTLDSLPVPSLHQSKRVIMARAESTPILRSDVDPGLAYSDYSRRRRRRNSSCPESREIDRSAAERRRQYDEDRTRAVLQSDEEFGSAETVIDRRYYHYEPTRQRSAHNRLDGLEEGTRHRSRRKDSCPDCREEMLEMERAREQQQQQQHQRTEHRPRRRRNSSCPEPREFELDAKERRPAQQQQQQQQPKRNVAISDTLEYYEYSMESESQCSENCGFGPCDPRRPHERAPRPGNANSNLFDSHTATSDTAKYPRTTTTTTTHDDHHHNYHHHHDQYRDYPPPPPPPAQPSMAHYHHELRPTAAITNDVDYDNVVVVGSGDDCDDCRRLSRRRLHDELSQRPTRGRVDDDGYGNDDRCNNRRSSSMPECSDYASQSSSYEKPSRYQHDDHNSDRRNGSIKRGQFTRSFSNADAPTDEKVDGSLSDTAVGLHVEESARRGRKSSPSSKSGSGSSNGGASAVQYQPGLGKKSNSTSQLSATECSGNVLGGSGFMGLGSSSGTTRKRNSTPSSIQRSQEVMPSYHHQQHHLQQQPSPHHHHHQRLVAPSPSRGQASGGTGSCASDTAGSLNSISSSEGSSWSPSLRMAGESDQLNEFIEGLGPGQLVGRQVLGAPSLGDIQLSLSNTKGYLEVEVVRARDLQPRPGSKVLPAPYVKVYLVNGKKCIAKAKTMTARKTLEPFYQQPLSFRENFQGCILQVTVWGDYGRLEGKKVFMGVAQIMLDNLNLSEMVFGWYKLFGTTSLVSGPPSLGLSRRSSAASLESLKF